MEMTEQLINEKCEALKAELLKLIKPVLTRNKWYWVDLMSIHSALEHQKALICFQGYETDHFGFDYSGNWSTHFGTRKESGILGNTTEATSKEILNALIKEAHKRGFVTGEKVTALTGATKQENTFYVGELRYRVISGNWVFGDDNWVIMKDGAWAKVLKSTEWYVKDFQYKHPTDSLIDYLEKNNLKIVPDETNP
jgi:hypothetical protein